MKGIFRFQGRPSLYETVSMTVAILALIVSTFMGVRSYDVSENSLAISKEVEEAQKENLLVRCGSVKGTLQFVSTHGDGTIDAIVVGWRSRVTNNSLAPVNLKSTHIDISMPNGHDILGEPSYSNTKYGADHLLSDEGIYLAAGQNTSIGFDQAFPISPGAFEVAGVRDAPTVLQANEVLHNAHSRMNLFEIRESGALGADDEFPLVEFTVITSRGKTFSGSCSF